MLCGLQFLTLYLETITVKQSAFTLMTILLLASVALTGCGLVQEPQAPSEPIAAEPLATAPEVLVADPAATTEAEPAAAPEPTAAVAPAALTATSEPQANPVAAAAIFEIIPAESEARFKIDETLQGAPKTVIGTTDQVAGQIEIDPAEPGATRVGEIRVNARGLTTDNNFRNRAIKNWILKTDQFEFVTFQPTEIVGLPESGSVVMGQPFSFQIKGDLTVTGVTLPVTFDVTVTPESEMRIQGEARTQILHKDFDLAIPDAPVVDEVKEEVILELSFVAAAS
jgi:polyisoprenoid-binding protein YceI